MQNKYYHRRLIIAVLALAVLALTACAQRAPAQTGGDSFASPMPTFPQATPTMLVLSYEEEKAAATLEAIRAQIAQQTAQAQATTNAWNFQTTQTAVAFDYAQRASEATASSEAATRAIAATDYAAQSQATQTSAAIVATANGAAIIATATARAETEAAADRARARESGAVNSLLATAFFIGVGIAFILLVYRLLAGLVDAESARRRASGARAMDTFAGTLVFDGDGYKVLPPAPTRPQLTSGEDEFYTQAEAPESLNQQPAIIPYNVNGKAAGYVRMVNTPKTEEDRAAIMKLLRAAIMQVGPAATRIPGHRDLGWSGDTHNRAVRLLGAHVQTKSGRGGGIVLVGRYASLRELYDAVGRRAVTPAILLPLPPSPPNPTAQTMQSVP